MLAEFYGMIKAFIFEITRPTVISYYVATTLIFGFAGPFGTYDAYGILGRLAFWGWVIGVAILIGLITRVVYLRLIGPQSFWVREVFCISTFSAVFTPVLWFSILWMSDEDAEIPLTFLGTFAFVAMVAILSIAIEQAVKRAQKSKLSDTEGPPEQPALLNRVAPELRGSVLALRARDHYVDVTTDLGQDAVLMRFADAISQLDKVEGVRVHRSHWVARKAVAGSVRRNGSLFLTLSNGEEIPVSRSYRAAVEATLL